MTRDIDQVQGVLPLDVPNPYYVAMRDLVRGLEFANGNDIKRYVTTNAVLIETLHHLDSPFVLALVRNSGERDFSLRLETPDIPRFGRSDEEMTAKIREQLRTKFGEDYVVLTQGVLEIRGRQVQEHRAILPSMQGAPDVMITIMEKLFPSHSFYPDLGR